MSPSLETSFLYNDCAETANNTALLLEALKEYAAEQQTQQRVKKLNDMLVELQGFGDLLGLFASQYCASQLPSPSYDSPPARLPSPPRWARPDWHVLNSQEGGQCERECGTGVFIPKPSTQYTDYQKELVYSTIEKVLQDEEEEEEDHL